MPSSRHGERLPDLLAGCEVLESAETDYAFRMFLPKGAWALVLVPLAEEMDYDNFKDDVHRHQGAAGTAYVDALHKVWRTMERLQR